MSLNLSFGGDEAPQLESLAAALASRGLPHVAPATGPLQVWSVKQAAPALLAAAEAAREPCPVLTAISLSDTAFVPIDVESFETTGGCVVASLPGLLADLERLGELADPIAEDARYRFLLAARAASDAHAVLWLG